MKYCKSKRGYFYKVVGDKKTRISIEEYNAGCKKHAMKGGFDDLRMVDMLKKEGVNRFDQQHGGKLDVDGKLDTDDFISKQEIVRRINKNHSEFELEEIEYQILPRRIRPIVQSQNRNSKQNFQNQTVLPKEIIQKRFPYEPYIFFGYNQNLQKYIYVSYNKNFSKIPVFRKLENDGTTISDELALNQIKKINNRILLQLCCFLSKKTTNRPDGTQYMERLLKYLLSDVGVVFPDDFDCYDLFP